jgi:hypothetical protein
MENSGFVRRLRWLWGVLLVAMLLPAADVAGQEAPQTIALRVDTPFYQWDQAGLRVPGYATLDIPGAPALPMWSTAVELPAAGQWTIRVQAGPGIRLPLAQPLPAVPVPQLDLNGPQPWQEAAELPASVPLVDRPDPAIYGGDALYPAQLAQAGPEQWQQGRRLLLVRAFPFQFDPAGEALLYYPTLRITVALDSSTPAPAPAVLATPAVPREDVDGGLRIYTGQRGLYRLTYQDLQGQGVPVASLNPATLTMYYLNQPVDIQVTGAADGRFDPDDLIIFYAQPYVGRYMTRNVYQLTYGGSAGGPRMTTRAVSPQPADPLATVMARTVRLERNKDYRSLYPLPPGADRWFDNALFVNSAAPTASTTYTFEGEDAIVAEPGNAVVRASLHGGTENVAAPDQSVAVRLNSHALGVFQWDGSTPYLATATVSTALFDQTPNRITLEAARAQLPNVALYWISPDWVETTYPARIRAAADRLYVEAIPDLAGQRLRVRAEGWSSRAPRVYDVRDPNRPVQLTTVQASDAGSSWTVDFWDQWPASAAAPSYFVATESALLAPLAVERGALPHLLSPANNVDYIAIVHASLADAIQPLLDRRAAEGLRVKKVDVQEIYDEFNGGRVDPEAIRTFLAYAYQQWNQGGPRPTYVLLVGDGHYDFKNHMATNLPNLIPPYLLHVDPFLGETAVDNRYVSVDGPDDFLPEMHIGRIPAKSAADVTAYVAKVAAYEAAPAGAWQQRAVFVADNKDDPAGNFHTLSDLVRLNWLPEEYEDSAIYYRMDPDHDTGAEMRAAIKAAMNHSAAYLQWFGHASQFRWGSVSMFDILDPATLAANAQLPFTVHLGCWSGYFIGIQGSPIYNRNEQSLGEVLVLTPGRGAVADLSPTGLHVGSALLELNRGLVKALFQDGIVRAGAAVDASKLYVYQAGSSYTDVIDTQVLFGDPALRLRIPRLGQRFVFLPMVQAQ